MQAAETQSPSEMHQAVVAINDALERFETHEDINMARSAMHRIVAGVKGTTRAVLAEICILSIREEQLDRDIAELTAERQRLLDAYRSGGVQTPYYARPRGRPA